MIEKDIRVGEPLPSPVMFTQFLEQSKCPICDKEKTLQLTGTVQIGRASCRERV